MASRETESEKYYRRAAELCRGIMERDLPGPIAISFAKGSMGRKLVGVRVAQDFEEIDKYRPWERRIAACCVCGRRTRGAPRQAALIFAEWQTEGANSTSRSCSPAWVHHECLALCPETDQKRGVVW